MKVTEGMLNRSTLERQMLLERERVGVGAAVRRVVAIQAQQSASPYVALWNRVSGFDPSELDSAFHAGGVVKATLMRMTLHAVTADDYRTFREAMEPSLRATRLGRWAESSGMTLEEGDALVRDLLDHADRPLTVEEIKAWLEERVGADASPVVWRQLRGYAPLHHAPTGGPWTFGHRPSYAAAKELPAMDDTDASAESMRGLVLRYLEGFGPASVADVAQFAMVQHTRVRAALESLSDEVEILEGPDGKPVYDVSGAPVTDGETPAPPRLMAMWDSVLLAYRDRSRIIPPEYRKLMIRNNGDVLPTLLVDGYVAGVWRATDSGIEATAFHHLTDEAWEGLAAEARPLAEFLAVREARVYGRYDHWWAKLPEELESRMLTTTA